MINKRLMKILHCSHLHCSHLRCSHNKSKLRLFPICIGILLFFNLVFFLSDDRVFAQHKGFKAPVTVSRIIQMDVPQSIKMVGTVFPFRESLVACEVEGLVKEFPVKRGDYVKKGQVLAKLRTASLEIQLKGAKADKHLAFIEYQRAKELYESETISHQEIDKFMTKLIAQKAEVEGIEDDIGKCTIKAPFDGRITEEYTEVGQWLDKGDRVVSMIEMDYVKVRVPVPEKHIQSLKIGGKCTVSFSALGGKTRSGHIIHIVPQADARARTFPVYIKLDNKDEMIKSGMFAEAAFETGSLALATMVLKDGVVRRGGREFIYLAVDGKVVEVPVRTGIAHKNLIRIMGDVKPGVDVIVRGNERVRRGQAVQITGRIDPDT